MNLNQAQSEYDNELPDKKNYCLRCDEEIDSGTEDHCKYCQDIITRRNKRDNYIAKKDREIDEITLHNEEFCK